MKILYFDCAAGVSCEMMVGALLDLGCDIHFLAGELSGVNFGAEYEINLAKTQKQGISASLFEINTEGVLNRKISDTEIISIISESGLNPRVKRAAVSAFLRILSAAAIVSDSENKEMFFPLNEAIKTVVSICSCMILTDVLSHDTVIFSPVCEGSGFVRRKNNIYSIPEPIVSEILRQGAAKVNFTSVPRALITAGGAAVSCELCRQFSSVPPIIIKAVGYGAASFDLDDRPAVLRVISGETEAELAKNIQTDFNMETAGLFYENFGYNMNTNSNKKG